jgi:hypothetical protein
VTALSYISILQYSSFHAVHRCHVIISTSSFSLSHNSLYRFAKLERNHSFICCLWNIPGRLLSRLQVGSTRQLYRSEKPEHLPGISGIHFSLLLQKNSPFGGSSPGLSRVPYAMYVKSVAGSYAYVNPPVATRTPPPRLLHKLRPCGLQYETPPTLKRAQSGWKDAAHRTGAERTTHRILQNPTPTLAAELAVQQRPGPIVGLVHLRDAPRDPEARPRHLRCQSEC